MRSPCGCHVIVRRPYLHVLPTYGVLTHSHVVSACTCDELGEFFRPMSGYNRTTFRCFPEVPAAAASKCRPFHRRDYILHKSVSTMCVVSAEHVLTRYGQREFCVLIGQLNPRGGGGGTHVYWVYGDVPLGRVTFSGKILRHGSPFH